MTALRGSEKAEEEKKIRRRSMIMRSCSLDLQLFRPSYSASSGSRNFHLQSGNCSSTREYMKIFHKMQPSCVCDAPELQARAILWVARREMEEKLNFSTRSNNDMEAVPFSFQQILQMQAGSSTSGLSLKKSLRRFLEKRRDRIQSAIPYKQALF